MAASIASKGYPGVTSPSGTAGDPIIALMLTHLGFATPAGWTKLGSDVPIDVSGSFQDMVFQVFTAEFGAVSMNDVAVNDTDRGASYFVILSGATLDSLSATDFEADVGDDGVASTGPLTGELSVDMAICVDGDEVLTGIALSGSGVYDELGGAYVSDPDTDWASTWVRGGYQITGSLGGILATEEGVVDPSSVTTWALSASFLITETAAADEPTQGSRYDTTSRRVFVQELPHQVTRRMLDNL